MAALFFLPTGQPLAETVKTVLDGDTLVLKDGRHVRLIGIDTPELGHKGKPSEPFSRKARKHLISLLKTTHQQVKLEFDAEQTDRYGRTLAHVFLSNGQNLNLAMLASGLATQFPYPPNLKYIHQYADAQSRARAQGRNRWSYLNEHIVEASKVHIRDAGVRLLRGRVTRVRKGRDTTWVLLDGRVTLKLTRSNIHWFHDFPPNQWKGREIEVLGKLYFYHGEARLQLRHPTQILSPAPDTAVDED